MVRKSFESRFISALNISELCVAGELGGTALAGVGAILLAAGSGSNRGVTLVGDLVSLISACLFLVYMAIGRQLRSWMPVFVYMLPVTLVSLPSSNTPLVGQQLMGL